MVKVVKKTKCPDCGEEVVLLCLKSRNLEDARRELRDLEKDKKKENKK